MSGERELTETTPPTGVDQFGRRIEYLRISVTDRCNFRCLYCMPSEGLQWLPKSDILSYEEIAGITKTSVGALKASFHLAVKKIEDFLKDD